MDEAIKLPELPEAITDEREAYFAGNKDFTAEQMRAYGAACARAALEEAAKVCESQFPSEVYDPEKGIEERAFADCAASVRNIKVRE